ncbi:phosphoribosylformylglycinamidine cyclo-ligase [bacterium]|nr:phosphoribosylformylglycinamidine cyclo-ligase [bacterium]
MSGNSYKNAGVDIERADSFIKKIKPLLEKTSRPEVLGELGGFSSFFKPQIQDISHPVLVSSTDGVGTKLLLADLMNQYDTLGIDLVAMCADDVVVAGAEPLFFLDYIACGKLNPRKLQDLMKGMAEGCRQAGCALVGGETAELPGMYAPEKFDLAGFCVGMVGQDNMIDGKLCEKGDLVVGLASSGLHSNGFSLVRKLFSEEEIRKEWGKEFLKPTRIYSQTILQIIKKFQLKAIAHITGGGFYGNIPRVIPEGLTARIKKKSWPVPSVFPAIKKRGRTNEKEMFSTFNMGIGMILVLSSGDAEPVLSLLEKSGEKAWIIGELVRGKTRVEIKD